jgi:DNA-binding response OmpR family regulator
VPTVIAINNSADLLNVIRERLLEQGFTVYLRHPSSDTYDLIRTLERDLVILDLVSQDAYSFKLLELLRRDRQNPRIPIIVMVAPWQKDELVKLKGEQGITVLVKPFSLPDLLRAVDSVLPGQILFPPQAPSAGSGSAARQD